MNSATTIFDMLNVNTRMCILSLQCCNIFNKILGILTHSIRRIIKKTVQFITVLNEKIFLLYRNNLTKMESSRIKCREKKNKKKKTHAVTLIWLIELMMQFICRVDDGS